MTTADLVSAEGHTRNSCTCYIQQSVMRDVTEPQRCSQRTARRHIPEDNSLYHLCENLKLKKKKKGFQSLMGVVILLGIFCLF
jgi:hypothetical protein